MHHTHVGNAANMSRAIFFLRWPAVKKKSYLFYGFDGKLKSCWNNDQAKRSKMQFKTCRNVIIDDHSQKSGNIILHIFVVHASHLKLNDDDWWTMISKRIIHYSLNFIEIYRHSVISSDSHLYVFHWIAEIWHPPLQRLNTKLNWFYSILLDWILCVYSRAIFIDWF